jgi:ADP-ribosyl-[dinitrogen reductase] hydrolase
VTDAIARARGALIGLAVGDALGGPLEFMSPAEARATHGGPVTEMVGGGWLHLRPGQTTDDTAMALALARSLDECGTYDEADVLRRYLAWRASSPPDIGITVAAVLGAAAAGEAPRVAAERFHHESGGKSAGNGSLMRIAPVALRFAGEPDVMADVARRESTLLHFDPLAADACAWYCGRLAGLLDAPAPAQAPAPAPGDGLDPRIAGTVALDRAAAGERAEPLGGFVLAALGVAAAAVASAESYEEALVWAINLGGDADTNGAIAGALLGARFGEDAIPERWRSVVEEADELGALAERLVAAAG